jgi:NAD-specific glutamate dehydrogenase
MIKNNRTQEELEGFLTFLKEHADARVNHFKLLRDTISVYNAPQLVKVADVADVVKCLSIRDAMLYVFNESKPARDAFFTWWNSKNAEIQNLSLSDKAPLLCLMSGVLLLDKQYELAKEAAQKAINYDSEYSNLSSLILTAINQDDKFMSTYGADIFSGSISATSFKEVLGIEKEETDI